MGVAGLLAVVLALASSPAHAAKQVVTIQSPDAPGNVGAYTISWETQGGCDPGAGTSGASGSVTITVADDGTPNDGQGTQAQTGVVIDTDCNYEWSPSLVNADGDDCRVDDFDTPDAGDAITLALTADGCATTGKMIVTVEAAGVNVGDCIEAPGGDGTHDDADCGSPNGNTPPAGGYRVAGADDVTHPVSAGAASATTFTVTATPQAVNGEVPEGCNAVSEDTETEYDDMNNPRQEAELTVVARSLGGANCLYTVTAALPPGFAAGDGSPRNADNSKKDQEPGSVSGGLDGDPATADDNNDIALDLTVTIADVKVYLVQNVVGDAGGAAATYELDTPCGAPGLPSALAARTDTGGITQVSASTVVELRTGRYNMTAALADDPSKADVPTG
ncbi:MAG: hypothetical protein F4078_04510 [Acidimicrobiia bacterium]|nr:hypothetical protein [Acidimicrobiia bacterium]